MNWENDYHRANDLIENEQYSEAEELLLVLLNQAPSDELQAEALFDLCDVYRKIHKLGQAMELLTEYHHLVSSDEDIQKLKQEIGNPQFLVQTALKVMGNNDQIEADLLIHIATVCSGQGSFPEAEVLFQQALKISQGLCNDLPDNEKHKDLLAGILCDFGALYHGQGRFPEAEVLFQQALKISQGLCNDFPDNEKHKDLLTGILCNFGALYYEQGRFPEAEDYHQEALKISKGRCNTDPKNVRCKEKLASINHNLALSISKRGCFSEADVFNQKALKILQDLCNRFPEYDKYKNFLARNLCGFGTLYAKYGRLPEAKDYHQEAMRIREGLCKKIPWNIDLKHDLSESLFNYGIYLQEEGNYLLALNQLLLAKELVEEIHKKSPTQRNTSFLSRSIYPKIANLKLDHLPSVAHMEEARNDLKKAIEMDPEHLENYLLLFRVIHAYRIEKARTDDPLIPEEWLEDFSVYKEQFDILSRGDVESKIFLGDYYLRHPEGTDFKRAENAYRRAWLLDSRHPCCSIKLATMFCRKNDMDAARDWNEEASKLLLELLDSRKSGRIKDDGLVIKTLVSVLLGRLEILKSLLESSENKLQKPELVKAEEAFLADEVLPRYSLFSEHELYKEIREALRGHDSQTFTPLIEEIQRLQRNNKFYFQVIKRTFGERLAAFVHELGKEYNRLMDDLRDEEIVLEDLCVKIEEFLNHISRSENTTDWESLNKSLEREYDSLTKRMGVRLLKCLEERQVRMLCQSLHLARMESEQDVEYSLSIVGIAKVLEELLVHGVFLSFKNKEGRRVCSDPDREDFQNKTGLDEKIKNRLVFLLRYIKGSTNLMFGNIAGLVGDVSLRRDMARLIHLLRAHIEESFKDPDCFFSKNPFHHSLCSSEYMKKDIEKILSKIGYLRNAAAHAATKLEQGITKDKNELVIKMAIGELDCPGLIPLLIMAREGRDAHGVDD